MTEHANETEAPETAETPETPEAEAPEAHTRSGLFDRAWEAVGAEKIEAQWGEALGKARGFLEARPLEAPLTHLRERSQHWLRTGPVARAQQRGASLLLNVVQPVRTAAERFEASLRQAQAEASEAPEEGTPAAA